MADDEQFSLCWNNFNSNLSAGFHESLCRGDLVDVTLAAEGQLVKAHRLVLSVCSPYFRKMFTQMPANQHAFVFLKDVSHAALKDLIQFMYCGEVNVKQDALPAFISTAEALQIKGLTETGDTTPAPQPQAQPAPPSPVKEMPPLVASTPITLVHQTTAPRQQTQRIVQQRQRQQSYKTIESESSSDEKVIIHHQQQQISQKRPAPKILSPVSAPAIKRAKQQPQIVHQTAKSTSDPLEAPTPVHITVSQPSVAGSIVSQQHILDTKSIASDTEFIDLPIETINPKSEPEYEEVDDDQADNQHEQLQQEMEHESETEQDQQYADDNQSAYGSIKYDESYFTTTEQTSAAEDKAGASGMNISGVDESYATETGEPSSAAEAQDHRPVNEDFVKLPIISRVESCEKFKTKPRIGTDNVEGEASNDSTSGHNPDETMSTISKKLSNKIYKLCQKRSNVRSIVWDVFFPVQDETGTIMPHIFACSFCNKVVRHTVKTTSALLSHLCVRNLNTPSAAAPIVRVKLVGDDRKRSVLTFIKFIVVDGQPLKVVEGSGFKAMLQFAVEMGHKYGGNLDIDDFIPQRAILAQNITNLKKKFDITILKDIALHARNGYSLTSDLWNDKNNSEHFLGLTICFMKNEELVNYTLAVKAMDHEKSTGLDIAKKAKSILQDYDLAKSYKDDAVMVTGRSSNMIAAFQSIELERLNCAAQLMDSTLSEAIEDAGEPITTVLIQCRKVVLFMKKSGQHQTMFDTSLKSDCPARWYSCYFMCHSVFANHKKLVDTLSVISSKALLISKIDYDLLSQLTTLLGFFKSSSEILEAAKAPTIHLVYPAIVHLETACKPNDDDLQPIANLKADLLNRIKKTFRANISTYHRAAVLLNPLSNQLRVLTETEANEAIAYVKAAMVNLERQPTAKAKPVATGRVISKNYHNLMKYNTKTPTTTQSQGLREAFSASFSVAPMTSSSVESIEEELNRYKRQLFYVPTGQNPLHFDTLAFWQQHKTDYPRLAAVAQTLFAIPATSSAAERVFSKDRNLITDYRSSLSAANINDFLSITANAEYVEWEQEHFEI